MTNLTPSLNAMRVHAQMMSLFAVLGIPISTAVVIDEKGARVSLPVGKGDKNE